MRGGVKEKEIDRMNERDENIKLNVIGKYIRAISKHSLPTI